MFDIKTIVLGSLVVMAVIAIIITFYPRKPKTTWHEWWKQVQKEFYKENFSAAYVEALKPAEWRDAYDAGMSPRDAFLEHLFL